MTEQISDRTRIQIRGMLEYRNLIEAIRVYREATGCGLKEAKDAVERLRDQLRQEDPARFGGIKTTRSTRGARWTLVGGIMVFVAILSTVYAYVFPRFSGEPVSAKSSLEIRTAHQEPSEHSEKMNLPDGGTWYVDRDLLLSAADFSSFRMAFGENGVTQLILTLSATGQENLKLLKRRSENSVLSVIVHKQLIACIALKLWSTDRVIVPLTGFSSSDANEIFARLTE